MHPTLQGELVVVHSVTFHSFLEPNNLYGRLPRKKYHEQLQDLNQGSWGFEATVPTPLQTLIKDQFDLTLSMPYKQSPKSSSNILIFKEWKNHHSSKLTKKQNLWIQFERWLGWRWTMADNLSLMRSQTSKTMFAPKARKQEIGAFTIKHDLSVIRKNVCNKLRNNSLHISFFLN